MIAISIEEEHRNQTHKIPVEHQPRANLIVGNQRVNNINSNSKVINKGKTTKNKKLKANKPCWNYGQVGHWAKLCPNKKAKTGQTVVNMVVGGFSGASTSGATEGYVSIQPELLTIYKPYDWLIDTGVNVHVCADKSLFVSYQAITGKTVSMGNSSTVEVLGIGSVDLKFPSGRILSLKRVHHVPTVRRNIISETQTGKKLKRLRSDRGGEYESSKFNEYCQTFGIIHEETPPYSLSSNGVAERKNRTFKDMINNLLLTSGLPKYLWGGALNTACHILYRFSLKHNTSTPFELWKGRKPSFKYFRVWGCLAKVLVPEHKRKKSGLKTVDVVFLGYMETSYALRFLVIKSKIPGIEVNTIVEFRDVVFLEDVFPMKTGIPSSVSLDDSLASTSIPEHVEKMTNVGVNPNSTNLTYEESDIPRRSKRARVVKDFGSDFVTYNIEDDPITFKDAMTSSEAKQWKEAIKSEMDSIVSNGTWVLVDLPPGCTTIGSLASVYNLSIHQMDVKTAFLYGELEEEIYMDQPKGFLAHGSCIEIIIETKSFLMNKFEMKDMGEADVILGIKLIRSTDGIVISQSHCVEKIIEKFGYQNNRIAKTPYDSFVALFKNESGVSVSQLRYSQIIESLQYLTNGTRPDISFSVSKLARYTSCPDKTYWSALDMVLRYLKGTVSLVIHYGRFPAVLEGYSDAS
ncbi:UNVERIFIED_CONTAM: Retrovirus-related Pol polyprotein from transposon TNT 1-94 [Sesamum calycinum]|uniref:Retrovirus-related Pol polyprotein from transposon TNT 1-94 n=1 Tax=Sesamum calycinum TaxID=2727403 RepID=A0AAW2NUU8_9LAMI